MCILNVIINFSLLTKKKSSASDLNAVGDGEKTDQFVQEELRGVGVFKKCLISSKQKFVILKLIINFNYIYMNNNFFLLFWTLQLLMT